MVTTKNIVERNVEMHNMSSTPASKSQSCQLKRLFAKDFACLDRQLEAIKFLEVVLDNLSKGRGVES